jgi:hypothetical protein
MVTKMQDGTRSKMVHCMAARQWKLSFAHAFAPPPPFQCVRLSSARRSSRESESREQRAESRREISKAS